MFAFIYNVLIAKYALSFNGYSLQRAGLIVEKWTDYGQICTHGAQRPCHSSKWQLKFNGCIFDVMISIFA